jgi:hypothetical protein
VAPTTSGEHENPTISVPCRSVHFFSFASAELAGQALGVERGAGVSVLIAPDLGAFLDPDHVVAPGATELGVAALAAFRVRRLSGQDLLARRRAGDPSGMRQTLATFRLNPENQAFCCSASCNTDRMYVW